ncbi:MAG: hypothetical protein R6W90_05985 [Ignavibacteriaceae bacterium]
MKKWQWISLVIITIASLAVEFFFLGEYEKHWWSAIPGFYIIFGFIGCTAIIFLSKAYGKMLVQRKEDYYQREHDVQ